MKRTFTSGKTSKIQLVKVLSFAFCLLLSAYGYSQQGVSINTLGTPADPSAMLDVSSDSKGLLIPRVSLTSISDVVTIPNPAISLLVYNTNASMTGGAVGFFYFNGTIWVQAIGPQGVQGIPGVTGPTGPAGAQGIPGVAGPTGPEGVQGVPGVTGATGTDGAQGIQGVTGPTGADGAQNAWGLLGTAGTVAGTNFIGTTDANDLVFKTNNTEKMRVGTSGNVGIGVAGSNFPLEIRVPSTTGSQINLKLTNLLNPMYNSGSGVGLLFAPDDAAIAKMGIFVERRGSWGVGTMHFLSRTSSDFASADLSNSVMVITQNGNVGIATTTPGQKLQVNGSIKMIDGNQGAGKVLADDGSGTGVAKWTSISGMTGPTGPTGPTGADGAQGPAGPTGTQGAQGATGPTGADGAQNAWGLLGNAGTVAGTNFIGTTDNMNVVIKRNNAQSGLLDSVMSNTSWA